jgi:hypothetical protein
MNVEVSDLDVTLTTNFVNFCCDELNVFPSLITIEAWESSFLDGATGLCYEVNCKDEYLIMVSKSDRNITEIYDTIAHEMIHVKQFMKDNLNKSLCERHRPVYQERWWELEANQNSYELVKKYVDILWDAA